MDTRQKTKRTREEVSMDDVRNITSRCANDALDRLNAVKRQCNRDIRGVRDTFMTRIIQLNCIVNDHAVHLRDHLVYIKDQKTELADLYIEMAQMTRRLGRFLAGPSIEFPSDTASSPEWLAASSGGARIGIEQPTGVRVTGSGSSLTAQF